MAKTFDGTGQRIDDERPRRITGMIDTAIPTAPTAATAPVATTLASATQPAAVATTQPRITRSGGLLSTGAQSKIDRMQERSAIRPVRNDRRASAARSAAQQAGPTVDPVAQMFQPTHIEEEQTIAGQLNALLADDSKYIQTARLGAMETANERGLLNSSIAAGAGERAAIEAGLPIAQGDAATYANAATNATTAGYNYKLNAQNIGGNLQIAAEKAQADASLQAANNAAVLERINATAANDAKANAPGTTDPATGAYIPGGYKFEADKAMAQVNSNIKLTEADKLNASAAVITAYESQKDAVMNIQMQPNSSVNQDMKEAAIANIGKETQATIGAINAVYGANYTYTPSSYTSAADVQTANTVAAQAPAQPEQRGEY